METNIELLLNLPKIRVLDFSISDKEARIYCESTNTESPCPACKKNTSEVVMYRERTIRDMALLGRKVYLHLKTRQFHCRDCHRYFNEPFGFVEPSKTMTTRYEQYIYFMADDICISQVCVKEDVIWSTVNAIYQKCADRQLDKRKAWQQVRYLGIDEISIRKGKKDYACCLVDLERGTVLDFLENRQKGTIMAYFREKGIDFCKQVEVVSCDMWDAYSTLAGDLFPNAISVIDRYHFFVHPGKALDATRRSLRKGFPDAECFKRLRWALLKGPDDLSWDERQTLEKAFLTSPPLREVYQLGKDLKAIFDLDLTKGQASLKVEEWQEKAQKIKTRPIESFLKTLDNWKDKVLNFFHKRHTNAVVEGLNNAIRGIIRRSFGFHSFENLKRRVLIELG
jgi:transposase